MIRPVARARTTLDARGLAAECDVATGGFFEALAAGGDLHLAGSRNPMLIEARAP
ncbi:MAG TPA: hypothetical protein VFK02_26095 [Kofleriaceae bacterium]|nr:hypothetical protein [Kofleriaceae bacterium]